MPTQRAGMVIFDLDGTLTVPILDFDAIRAEAGLPPGPILESLADMEENARRAALEVLHRHEHRAAHGSELHQGAKRTLDALRAAGWPVAVVTRNARQWTEIVMRKHDLTIDALATRDDGVIKPSPEPILRLCRQHGCDPRASWMVGDHLFDIQSGRSAGCTTVLLLSGAAKPDYAGEADHVIAALPDLLDLIGE